MRESELCFIAVLYNSMLFIRFIDCDMSVSILTTLICRAEVVPAYRKSIFSPIKLATNIEPVHTYYTILQKTVFGWGGEGSSGGNGFRISAILERIGFHSELHLGALSVRFIEGFLVLIAAYSSGADKILSRVSS